MHQMKKADGQRRRFYEPEVESLLSRYDGGAVSCIVLVVDGAQIEALTLVPVVDVVATFKGGRRCKNIPGL